MHTYLPPKWLVLELDSAIYERYEIAPSKHAFSSISAALLRMCTIVRLCDAAPELEGHNKITFLLLVTGLEIWESRTTKKWTGGALSRLSEFFLPSFNDQS